MATPDEVIEWFAWHNGAVKPRVGITPLGPTAWTALSLEESLRARQTQSEGADYAAQNIDLNTTPSYWWTDTWLPIAEDGGQGVLAIDLREQMDTCAVRYVMWSNDEFRSVREDSLADLIDVWLAILRLGDWAWSTELGHWTGEYTAIPMELRLRSLM